MAEKNWELSVLSELADKGWELTNGSGIQADTTYEERVRCLLYTSPSPRD